MKKIIFSVLALTSLSAFAGGFQLNLQGARALGMGGAYTGLAHGPATTFFNPGGLTQIEGHQFNLGTSLIFPSVSLQTSVHDNIDQTTGMATPIHFYYGGQINEKLYVGFGLNNQFGSSSSFEDDWQGRYIVQNISLRTFMFQPTIAYKLHEKISIGIGAVYTTGKFSYEKAVPLTTETTNFGKARLEGKGSAFSFNVGAFSQLIKNDKMELGLGIDYRSGIKLALKGGTASFSDVPASLASKFPETTKFDGGLNLPSVATAGISFKYILNEKSELTFAYDFARTNWSSYDTLAFDFENEETPDSKTVKNWQNVNAHRFGVEYKINKLRFRVGGYHDQSPILDGFVSPELPDATHMAPTVGFGMEVSEMISFDIAYLSQKYSREASLDDAGFSAKYNRGVDVVSFSLSIKL